MGFNAIIEIILGQCTTVQDCTVQCSNMESDWAAVLGIYLYLSQNVFRVLAKEVMRG